MIKVLFGVSDTQECRRAIDTIVKFFGDRKDVELTLLHVSQDIVVYAQSGVVNYETIENIEHEKSNEILNEFDQAFKENGLVCQKILRTGNPIDIMLEIANEYDLLVIGASESSLLYRIFSSHQNSFVNSSPIPVLVAK
ncbi:universal stress protein [Helicobacter equorum]|uniref:Universal stress protein n=1 Tax=Helicobacter equorum TaxID=361872 RepID=A0A3D8IRV9_9HELI|nr:universal stress protein [Helicobacter equorum]MBR2111364.1 universal stress protein [Helicobacter sp.]MCI6313268.1 universal stress protein [Helicobacter sp.]MCI7711341.1 universal stress protein [Helicobacter sp.]RDU67942.1 universal stress protein [Helicobacter equorum]